MKNLNRLVGKFFRKEDTIVYVTQILDLEDTYPICCKTYNTRTHNFSPDNGYKVEAEEFFVPISFDTAIKAEFPISELDPRDIVKWRNND